MTNHSDVAAPRFLSARITVPFILMLAVLGGMTAWARWFERHPEAPGHSAGFWVLCAVVGVLSTALPRISMRAALALLGLGGLFLVAALAKWI
jgi:hypothetical protein